MPDKICFRTDQYTRIASRLQKLSQELDGCAAQLGRISMDEEAGASLSIQLSGRLSSTGTALPSGQIADCLRAMRGTLRSVGGYASTLSGQVTQAAEIFEQGEHDLISRIHDTGSAAPYAEGEGRDGISLGDLGYDLPIFDFDYQGLIADIADKLSTPIRIGDFLFSSIAGGLAIAADGRTLATRIDNSDGSSTTTMHIESKGKLKEKIDTPEMHMSDKDTSNFFQKVTDPFKGRISLLTVADSASYTNSMFGHEVEISGNGATVSAAVDLNKIDASASYGAGAYINKDGTFSFGAEAKVGASITAFEAGLSAQYEVIDGVSVSSDVTVTAGKIGTSGEAKIGITDEGVAAYGKVSMEAIAGEVSADVGVDIAGLKGNVSGSLNYGFGAHAEVGIQNGVVKFDVGASLGVGGSVSVELDVVGFAKNVKSGAKKIGKYVCSIFS